MSYDVDLRPRFIDPWRELPPDVAEYVLDQVELLAAHPVELSQSSEFPELHYQVFRFQGPVASPYLGFEVRFQYSQDEQSLHVLDLVWMRT
jgi:hypothetical protein